MSETEGETQAPRPGADEDGFGGDAPEPAEEAGHLDAVPVDTETGETGDKIGDGDDYPVAHMIDREVSDTRSLCGETISGDLLEDRTLAYTCAECQNVVTELQNVLADALLDSQLRFRVILTAAIGGGKIRPLDTRWTRKVREVAADAQDEILDQQDSGPTETRD